MQGISSYISCMKLINVIIISKTGFMEISLFKSLILAWNSFSTQQLFWLHGLATSRHAIPGFVHIDSSTLFFKKSLALCCSILQFWWLSLVPCWIIFPTPIHMLHSDLGCENHTTSKMMFFTKCIWSEMSTSATWNFLPFQPCNPLVVCWKSTEK